MISVMSLVGANLGCEKDQFTSRSLLAAMMVVDIKHAARRHVARLQRRASLRGSRSSPRPLGARDQELSNRPDSTTLDSRAQTCRRGARTPQRLTGPNRK